VGLTAKKRSKKGLKTKREFPLGGLEARRDKKLSISGRKKQSKKGYRRARITWRRYDQPD
jgi:hypothetical protein